jgi:hypothetical protein
LLLQLSALPIPYSRSKPHIQFSKPTHSAALPPLCTRLDCVGNRTGELIGRRRKFAL